ncbi:MAG: hypothetical protein A2X49_07920 [Lentisphaerae bacterium GWF2_52_8]|nr:MAG: hypothetical protein A2X49_07920 [Lentisphaerae bacterium GWF2_52_8]
MKKYMLFCAAGAVLLLSGCESMMEKSPAERAAEQRQLRMQQQLAQTQESSKSYESQIGQLYSAVRAMQDDSVAAEARIGELQRQLAATSQATQRHEQEIASLKQQLAAEQQARQEAINRMVDQVAKETASAINAASSRSSSASSSSKGTSSSSTATPPPGSYYEYTVQAGATLSAIAKAYKVTPEEIRDINKLKNDFLRVGQKLYIPKK